MCFDKKSGRAIGDIILNNDNRVKQFFLNFVSNRHIRSKYKDKTGMTLDYYHTGVK